MASSVGTKTHVSDMEQAKDKDKGHASCSSDSEDSGDGTDAVGRDKRQRKSGNESEEEVDADELRALQEDLGQDVRQGKRTRRGAVEEQDSKETAAVAGPSLQSDEVWKAMQSKADESSSTATTRDEPMVCVVKTYRFAGEEVREEKMLPASHPDAKAYLAKQQQQQQQQQSTAASAPPTRPPAAGPRRKKAGGGLAAMSAAATAKPTKLNTLEKSKMDWTTFKDSTLDDNARHEMDAQTKGGSSGLGTMKGYMERRNFLERVQDRLEGDGKRSK